MLKVENITKYYKKIKGVENLSFSLKSHKALGIIGINGSGKTTTFRVLLGLLNEDNGTMTFKNKPLSKHSISLFGYLPEERSLYSDLSVYDQIMFLGRLKKMQDQEILESMESYLSKLKISKYKFTKINKLSKGNQQKVQIICALIHNPSIIILDEPLSGLDIINVELLKKLIKDLKSQGKYILLSSHQFEHIEEFCDDLIILKDGNVQYYGKIKSLVKLSKYYYLSVDRSVGEKYLDNKAIIDYKISNNIISFTINSKEKLHELFKAIVDKEVVGNISIQEASVEMVVKEQNLI